jgi:hypothetical protein
VQAVSAAVPSPDVTLDGSDTALRVMRRRLNDTDVYLFFNEGAQSFSHAVTLRSDGKKAERLDPQTGTIAATNARGTKGAVKVQLELKPFETAVLIIR